MYVLMNTYIYSILNKDFCIKIFIIVLFHSFYNNKKYYMDLKLIMFNLIE